MNPEKIILNDGCGIVLTTEKKRSLYERPGVEVWTNDFVNATFKALPRVQGHFSMRDLYGKHSGETILVCGSGPSLASCPERPGLTTIAINRAITRIKADYWAFLDMEPVRLYGEHENAKTAKKLFGSGLSIYLKDLAPSYLVEAIGHPSHFKRPSERPIYWNLSTFSYVLPLAIKMGAKKIVCIGTEFTLDPYFDGFIPKGYEGDAHKGVMIIAHDRMREMFSSDKGEWYDDTVEILDASNGALPVPKVKLSEVLP